MKFVLTFAIIFALFTDGLGFHRFNQDRTRYFNKDISETNKHCEEKWFTQPLNHFNPMETRTWKQRYFVNDRFYKEGGPVFLIVSGEQVAHPAWLDEHASLEVYLAKKFGAKVLFLEHRYYGMSRPTEDLSLDNMIYLTTDQALADTAYFIQGMQSVHNIPRSSKWILFGASYAGSLVVWLRAKYPYLVHGAVANSAPLLAEVDFKDFYIVVQNALSKHSPNCVEVLKIAFNEVRVMLSEYATQLQLEKLFNVCSPHFELGNTLYDVINFYEGIVDIATEVVFNNDSFNLTIGKACSILEDESKGEPLARLTIVNNLLLKEQGGECLKLEKYNDTIKKLQNVTWNSNDGWDRRWMFQTCAEFGWYQTTTARPFDIPTSAIPIGMFKQMCTDIFGSRYNRTLELGVKRTNLIYGGLDIAEVTTNTVFVHGSNDPWHAVGVTNSSNPKASVVYVEGGGHCPLIYPPNKFDSPEKAQAKQQIEKQVDLWLQEV